MMQTFRTTLEQKIRERRQTFEEFAEYAETYAREHREPGTLSVRHLQRLAAGCRRSGQPLGPVRPATARLLEAIFGLSIDELLAPPVYVPAVRAPAVAVRVMAVEPARQVPELGGVDVRRVGTHFGDTGRSGAPTPFGWLDEHAGWIPDTSRRKVATRQAKLNLADVLDTHVRRSRVARTVIVDALSTYYGDRRDECGMYRVRCGDRVISTSVLTAPDWLDLACPITPDRDRLVLSEVEAGAGSSGGEFGTRNAVHRLAEAAALDVRIADAPLYRLLDVQVQPTGIRGTVGLVPFAEYALTMDLLESELVDAVAAGTTVRRGALPLRDWYLPDLASVLDVPNRLCAGGALALCAVARPADPYRGEPDYALLVQQRSGHVLNAARRLSVIPKAFHQPLGDIRADTRLGATLRRKMEGELFGRAEVDSAKGNQRVAAPMHPGRLSGPMSWLTEDSRRMRMECTGFGLNLVSGNYEFASLIVIEDDEFWSRFGGDIEANWEASGLRVYSSLDGDLIDELVANESWSNEGLFAFLLGIRRLGEIGGNRVALPAIESAAWSRG
ncbi:MAG TPA: transcriptional regulator [Pseudonocardiaceae bacterium]|jgi:hypothetical protein|nr:transcriptional regulator [Pseudonocardiaceae bacterium]